MQVRDFSGRQLALAAGAVFLCGLFLAGCDERITTYRDTSIPISKHATWAWRPAAAPVPQAENRRDNRRDDRQVTSRDEIAPPPRNAVVREPDAQNNTVLLEVRKAIEQQMNEKGFKQESDPQAADFLVDYHFAIHRHDVTVARAYGGYPGVVCGPYGCWDSWGWGPPAIHYENLRFREGTFVFDFVKSNTNQQAYRAIGQEPVHNHNFSQEDVSGMIHHLLKGLKGR